MAKVWPYESTSTKVTKPPKTDGHCESTIQNQRLEFTQLGMLLKRGEALGAPISSLYDPEVPGSYFAYLRILAHHRRRIREEIERQTSIEEEIARVRHTPKGQKDCKNRPLGRGLKWKDVKVVNCAGCRKLLLGESMEAMRTLRGIKSPILTKNLPPPVCKRTPNGPWCCDCVKDKRVR